MKVIQKEVCSIGGGIASFVLVDVLRVSGILKSDICIVSPNQKPYETFKRRCENSHISEEDRLRSDSGATPDNIWGWPGYGFREAWSMLKKKDYREAASILYTLFIETILSEPFTPRAGFVYRGIDREAKRIGWDDMRLSGVASDITTRSDDRYDIQVKTDSAEKMTIRCKYLHLGVGYARENITSEQKKLNSWKFKHVFEDQADIIKSLKSSGGRVLLRGCGISALRFIEYLYDLNLPNVSILHQLNPKDNIASVGRLKRTWVHNLEYQHYNFPKSFFGGELKDFFSSSGAKEKARQVKQLGGTTTANRKAWKNIIEKGLKTGFYNQIIGACTSIKKHPRGFSITINEGSNRHLVKADFIIDATGLIFDYSTNPFVTNLVETFNLSTTELNTLRLDDSFRVKADKNHKKNIFVSGILAGGNSFAPVDSFSGFLYAALKIADCIGKQNGSYKTVRGVHSFKSWKEWFLNIKI